jgi:hypothetical protein
MGKWASGVTDAKGSDRGEYLPEGTYDAEVVFTDAFDKRNGGGTLAKVRLSILASNNPQVKVGDEQDMCFNVDPSRKDVIDLQLADVRGYVMAVEKCLQKDVTEEVIYYVFERKNDAHVGKRLRISASTIETKAGKDFTKYSCKPFDEEAHKALRALRAA